MSIKSLAVIAVLIGADYLLKKKFPRFYKRLELPANIVFTTLLMIYCGFLLYSVYLVFNSGVSTGSKAGFAVFVACCIAVLVAIIVMTWKRWLKEKKQSYADYYTGESHSQPSRSTVKRNGAFMRRR